MSAAPRLVRTALHGPVIIWRESRRVGAPPASSNQGKGMYVSSRSCRRSIHLPTYQWEPDESETSLLNLRRSHKTAVFKSRVYVFDFVATKCHFFFHWCRQLTRLPVFCVFFLISLSCFFLQSYCSLVLHSTRRLHCLKYCMDLP